MDTKSHNIAQAARRVLRSSTNAAAIAPSVAAVAAAPLLPATHIERATPTSLPHAQCWLSCRAYKMRFKRDYKGTSFQAALPVNRISENFFFEDRCTATFGKNLLGNNVTRVVSGKPTIEMMMDWDRARWLPLWSNREYTSWRYSTNGLPVQSQSKDQEVGSCGHARSSDSRNAALSACGTPLDRHPAALVRSRTLRTTCGHSR
jgi:hypothetical protein